MKFLMQLLHAVGVPGHERERGAPHLTWKRVAYRDLLERGLSDSSWAELAKNRDVWKLVAN